MKSWNVNPSLYVTYNCILLYTKAIVDISDDSNGKVTGKVCNLAVSNTSLMEILSWKKKGATDQNVFVRLRKRTVPPAYRDTVHNWIDGIWNFHIGISNNFFFLYR